MEEPTGCEIAGFERNRVTGSGTSGDLTENYIRALSSARTNAGRRFEPDKSEKGNGTTTTSPFTGSSRPCPLRV